jgi:membrane-bound lytic murein transglycosylase B
MIPLKVGRWFVFFMLLCYALSLSAAQTQSWQTWLQGVRKEALSQGISARIFDQVFTQIKGPSAKVLRYDRSQPETRISFLKYRDTRADAYRIKLGRKALKKNRLILDEVSQHYGVSACFIVSFWGLETSYGRFMGSFPVIQSLATLAYDSRRGPYFRKQLFYALHILEDGHVRYQDFKGEWAGASGQPQFLPSSWFHYAVDYDKDGKRDIWQTKEDVFASIANYLVAHGWQAEQPWAIVVRLDQKRGLSDLLNDGQWQSIAAWQKLGVQLLPGASWPDATLKATLIRPSGGPDMLVFNNFEVIMQWNRSTYYAGTVGYMADRICGVTGS